MKSALPSEPNLRYWLRNIARVDGRILTKTIETLMAEDVFAVSDLRTFTGLPHFVNLFTALTREKIVAAIDAEAAAAMPPKPPAEIDSAVPTWLQEAEIVVQEAASSRKFELKLPEAPPRMPMQRKPLLRLGVEESEDDSEQQPATERGRGRTHSPRRGRERRAQSARAADRRAERGKSIRRAVNLARARAQARTRARA